MCRLTCYHATKFWIMEIGLGIAELWVDKLGWGQIPFSQNYGEYDKHNQNWIFNHLFRFLQTCLSQTTTKQITPHQKSSMNQCIFSSLSCFIACMQGCHSIHQMANLTNVAKMEFDPTPTYRPITARYLILFSSFKIWWHDNMLTYAHTKYWIHPITSY